MQRWWEKCPVLSWELLHSYQRHHFQLDFFKQVLTESHGVIQACKGHKRSVVQPSPAQSRVRHRVRPRCSGLYSGGSWQPPRIEALQPFLKSVTLLGCPNSEKNPSYPIWISLVSACACCLSLSRHSCCEEPSSASSTTLHRYWGLLRGAPEAIAAWGWTRPTSADFSSQSKCCCLWPSQWLLLN